MTFFRESRATTTFSSWSADDDGVQDKIVAVNEEEEAKPTNESSNKSRFNIKVGDDIMEAVSSSNEEEEEDGSDDESKADLETTLSIVRFARDVSLRRISYDVGKAAIASEEAERQQQQQQQQSHKLDITNFPRGPPQPLTWIPRYIGHSKNK